MWLAALLFAASHTGPRSRAEREYLLWGMPFAELLQYRHCAFRAADYWTIPAAVQEPARVTDGRLAAHRPTIQL